MQRNNTAKWGSWLALGWAATGLLLYPKEISDAVREGLRLCSETLLPTLFPFLVLSSFLISSGIIQGSERVLSVVMQPLFRLPGCCTAAVLLGAIGGYPTGAKAAIVLYQNSQCTKDEAQRTLAFCNNCGPAFLLGSLGCGVFPNINCGLLLMGVHFMAAILTGVIISSHADDSHSHPNVQSSRPVPTAAAFVTSTKDAMRAFLDLSAFVLCFSAIIKLIQLSGIPALIGQFLPLTGQNSEYLLLGLLEMTSGVMHLSSGSLTQRLILTSALVGWGGLSVHCQVLALIQDTDLSPALYFKGKALHALLSALIMALSLTQPVLLIPGICATFLFRFRHAKKAVEKKRAVYYNRTKETKLRELW